MMLIALMAGLASATQAPASVPAPDHRCWVTKVDKGVPVTEYIGYRKCIDFGPARTMTGVWVNDFEGSSFHEGAQNIADVRSRKMTVWLEIDDETVLPASFRRLYDHAYGMTFVGRPAPERKSGIATGYGHFGLAPGLVLIDRVISSEDLGLTRGR